MNEASNWTQAYRAFASGPVPVQAGDVLEYEVYLHLDSPGIGGIDLINTDGTSWRQVAGWADEDGIPGHPAANLAPKAFGRWHHRRLPVPPELDGKTVDRWLVAVDGRFAACSAPAAWYDHVVMTRAGQRLATLYDGGGLALDEAHLMSPNVGWAQLRSAPERPSDTQTGGFFFYWYDAPGANAYPEQMRFHPYGLIGDPWNGYAGGYYSLTNAAWWEAEFQDMKRAGMDTAALICWGEHPSQATNFKTSKLPSTLVPALERSGVGIRIIMFDDTTSQCCEWNEANGRGYTVNTRMPLSDLANWAYFYDRKIKPFFEAVPRQYWATHNGQPLEAGGRPVIITYTAAWFRDVGTHGTALWEWIKQRFAADFTQGGVGIVPWLIHETSWYAAGAGGPADGRYAWGAATNDGSRFDRGGFVVASIGPGYDDRPIRTPGKVADRHDGGRLSGSFRAQAAEQVNLLMVETWNELWEGTSLQRCRDYTGTAGPLADTHYLDLFRSLVSGGIGLHEDDATFLRTWEMPTQARRTSMRRVSIRNDGRSRWDHAYTLGGVLLNPSTGQPVAGSQRSLAEIPPTVSGQEIAVDFTLPTDWPFDGTYLLRLGVLRNGEWIASGSRPTRSVQLNPSDVTAPGRVSQFTATAGARRIVLAWTNPTTSDFYSTLIRMSTSSSPSSPTAGEFVAHRPAGPGGADSVIVHSLPPGQTVYFSAFTQDRVGNWSSRSTASAMPVAGDQPPAVAIDLAAQRYDARTFALTWTLPTDPDVRGAMVRYRMDRYPIDPADGDLLCDVPAQPGSRNSFIHTALPEGQVVYYAVFVRDVNLRYSAGLPARVTPQLELDQDLDGDVDQTDFGFFQACMTGPAIAQLDPACAWARLDVDADVDLNDFWIFQHCLGKAGLPADPGCAP